MLRMVRDRLSAALRRVSDPMRHQVLKKAEETTGFGIARRLWSAGVLGRFGLVTLLLGTVAVAAVIVSGPAQAPLAGPSVPVVPIALGLALFACGWAFALTAATRLPLSSYLLVSSYLAYGGMTVGLALAGTAAFALPALWTLLLGWRVARASPAGFSQRLWLLILCLGTGFLTFRAFGLDTALSPTLRIPGRVALGLAYFGLLGHPRALRQTEMPSFKATLAGTVLVVTFFFLLAAVLHPAEFSENALLAFEFFLGFLVFFWMLLGFQSFDLAVKVGESSAQLWTRVVPGRLRRSGILIVWGLAVIFAWLATYTLPPPFPLLKNLVGLASWVPTWPPWLYWTVHDYAFISLAAIAIIVPGLLMRRLSDQGLARTNSLWVAAFAALYIYYTNFFKLSPGGEQQNFGTSVTFASALVLIGGIVHEMATGGEEWSESSNTGVYGLVAFMMLMLGVSAAVIGVGRKDVRQLIDLYAFLGIVYLVDFRTSPPDRGRRIGRDLRGPCEDLDQAVGDVGDF